jgi:hypothetical protein
MRHFIFLFFVLSGGTGVAQNLVPNGDFEEYIECPDFLNQVYRATGWSRYRGSPDYFNRCDTSDSLGIASELLGVPSNAAGWQEPMTGDGYMGVMLYEHNPFGGQTREHLGAMLTEPLLPGVPVYLSFKVSPTTAGPLQDFLCSVDRMGLRFTMVPYDENDAAPLPNHAALSMSFAPMDTSSWYQVSGVYVPDSAYQYVVLGNFFDDTLTTRVVLNPNSDDVDSVAYVYLDDVCISYDSGYCDMDMGLIEECDGMLMHAYPMPFKDRCTVMFNKSINWAVYFELLDVSGRHVWQGKLLPGQRFMEICMPNLPPGVYTLRTTSPIGALKPIVLLHISP